MRLVILFCAILSYTNMTTLNSDFWIWFQENEKHFPATEEFHAAFGRELSKRLKANNPGLVYEISIPDEGLKELVISADGIKELIPNVEQFVQSAPKLEGWKITAFRPRIDDYSSFELSYLGRKINSKELWFYSRVENGYFDLIVYHPEYSEHLRPALTDSTYILLDMAIGEYDVMTGIRYIDHQQLPENPEQNGLYPYSDLRRVFDEYKHGT